MAIKRVYLEVFVALIFVFRGFEVGKSAVTENENDHYYEQFQNIPSAPETARKLYKFLIGGVDGKIVKRQILGQISKPRDITFIIDSSSSVSSFDFRKGSRALQLLTSKFHPDSHSRFAIITIATRAKIQSKFTSRVEAGRLLGKLRRSGGKTNTQEALALCQDLYRDSNDSGVRSGSLRKVLVVTDGRSNIKRRLTVPNAARLKIMRVEVFVIAVGEYLDGIEEMAKIASSTDGHMARVVNTNGLMEIVKLVPKQERSWLYEIVG